MNGDYRGVGAPLSKNVGLPQVLVMALALALLGGECPIESAVDKISRILNDAVGTLENESIAWQGTLQDSLNQIEGIADDAIADVQSTLQNELSNVIQRGVAAVGVEARCGLDFVHRRKQQEIRRIIEWFQERVAGGTASPPDPLPPHACQVVPDVIERSQVPGRVNAVRLFGYDWDRGTIDVRRRDGTTFVPLGERYVSRPTHYEMTLNLGANGIPLNDLTNQLVVRWSAGGGSSVTLGSISVIQPTPPVCQIREEVKRPTPIRDFSPGLLRGDREFGGNGPTVDASVTLTNQRSNVNARLCMRAEETDSNGTPRDSLANGCTTRSIYTPRAGFRVSTILSHRSSTARYRDTNHDIDRIGGNPGGGPVNNFQIMGDGGGDDIGRHTRIVAANFNEIRYRLIEAGNCVTPQILRSLRASGQLSPDLLLHLQRTAPGLLVEAEATQPTSDEATPIAP